MANKKSTGDSSASKKNTGKNTGKRSGIENLRPPWGKGESGNPNGRPKKAKLLSDEIERQMMAPCDIVINGKQPFKDKKTLEVYVKAQISLAMKGNATALKEINDRFEGKVAQPITGEDGGPIEFSDEASKAQIFEKLLRMTPKERKERLKNLRSYHAAISDSQ